MVDLNKLRTQKKSAVVVDPIEIFRRLPKPSGINDRHADIIVSDQQLTKQASLKVERRSI